LSHASVKSRLLPHFVCVSPHGRRLLQLWQIKVGPPLDPVMDV
jgi:hypothetical protein